MIFLNREIHQIHETVWDCLGFSFVCWVCFVVELVFVRHDWM